MSARPVVVAASSSSSPPGSRSRPGRGRRGLARVGSVLLIGLLAMLAPAVVGHAVRDAPHSAAVAWAHGALAPPTAVLGAEGHTVTVHWQAAEDDAAAIAVVLGQLPASVFDDHLVALAAIDDVAEIEPLVAALADEVDSDALAVDPGLMPYLLDTIRITQAGDACHGQVTDVSDLLRRGAALRFHCPAVVDTIEVTITVLTEHDPTHATFSTDGRGDVAVHTAGRPTHRWELGDQRAGGAAGSADAAWLPLVAGLVVAAALATGAVLALRPEDRP